MRKCIFILCLLLLSLLNVKGQLIMDFSGELKEYDWQGDMADFKVNASGQLQLDAAEAGVSYLSHPLDMNQEMEWQFWVKLAFATSANNNARFYLLSDCADLTGDLNGYFIQLGEKNDSVMLYKQSGDVLECLFVFKSLYTNASVNSFSVKVLYSAEKGWELFSCPNEQGCFQKEGELADFVDEKGAYLGCWCKYTSSNRTKCYFDDLYAGPKIIDSIPPQIRDLRVLDSNQLKFVWNERMEVNTVLDLRNYALAAGQNAVVRVIPFADEENAFVLYLKEVLDRDVDYQLIVDGLMDVEGNRVTEIFPFRWHIPQWMDVLIHEIMADPSPAVALPECEYVELYNASDAEICLDDWKLMCGDKEFFFGNITLSPQDYLLCCDLEDTALMVGYGDCQGFASFSLTNSGMSLSLLKENGDLMHQVSYSDLWYEDEDKVDGGWSLEMIDPLFACVGEENWQTSLNVQGGSPGGNNSLAQSFENAAISYYVRAVMKSPKELVLYFPYLMNPDILVNNKYYVLEDGGFPDSVMYSVATPYCVRLILSKAVVDNRLHYLRIADELQDCRGLPLQSGKGVPYGLVQDCLPNDVVLNEVLTDAKQGSVDFVELYNRSEKVVDVGNLYFAKLDQQGMPMYTYPIASESYCMYPGEYLVLCSEAEKVYALYPNPLPANFLQMNFPNLSAGQGNIGLLSANNSIVDQLAYREEMHFSLLTTTDGVSLERVHPDRPSDDTGNWHSAAESAGFATPGAQNSQYLVLKQQQEWMFFSEKVFTPDNDGKDDVLHIGFQLDQPGYVLNLLVMDTEGRMLRSLANNELLAAKGMFSWDGTNENHALCSVGIYIVYAKAFHPDGTVLDFKAAVVLGNAG